MGCEGWGGVWIDGSEVVYGEMRGRGMGTVEAGDITLSSRLRAPLRASPKIYTKNAHPPTHKLTHPYMKITDSLTEGTLPNVFYR